MWFEVTQTARQKDKKKKHSTFARKLQLVQLPRTHAVVAGEKADIVDRVTTANETFVAWQIK